MIAGGQYAAAAPAAVKVPRSRLRYLVREVARHEPGFDAFRTSFGLRDQETLSDRATAEIAARYQLSERQLYERWLWRHLVERVLLRVEPQRRRQVKEQLGIESDEALALRVVHDLMQERGLTAEQAHDELLQRTLRERGPAAVQAVLVSTGVPDEEVAALLERAGYADPAALVGTLQQALEEVNSAPDGARARALHYADTPAPAELACLLVALAVRGGGGDAGARRALELARRIRRILRGQPAQPAASPTR